MNSTIKTLLIILCIIAIIICGVWFYKSPGFDSGTALITAIIALVSLFLNSGGNKRNIKMSQSGGKNSKFFQSGGDMTINN